MRMDDSVPWHRVIGRMPHRARCALTPDGCPLSRTAPRLLSRRPRPLGPTCTHRDSGRVAPVRSRRACGRPGTTPTGGCVNTRQSLVTRFGRGERPQLSQSGRAVKPYIAAVASPKRHCVAHRFEDARRDGRMIEIYDTRDATHEKGDLSSGNLLWREVYSCLRIVSYAAWLPIHHHVAVSSSTNAHARQCNPMRAA